MLNINVLNQNNNYSLGNPNIKTPFSSLEMGETTTSTGYMGKLIPIFVNELQPNQSVRVQQSINMQFTPFATSLMHQIKGEIISYFVPYRLIWDKWEDFITGGEDGMQNPKMPVITFSELILKAFEQQTFRNTVAKKVELAWVKIEKTAKEERAAVLARGDAVEIMEYAYANGKPYTATKALEGWLEYWNSGKPLEAAFASDPDIWNAFSWESTEQQTIDDLGTFLKNYNNTENLSDLKLSDKAYMRYLYPLLDIINEELTRHSLWDYYGLPINNGLILLALLNELPYMNANIVEMYDGIHEEVSVLPFRAYKKIYNDWIRLADWEEEIPIQQKAENYNIEVLDGNYDWDYFTRARRYQLRGAMPTIPVVNNKETLFQFPAITKTNSVNAIIEGGAVKFKPEGLEHTSTSLRLDSVNSNPQQLETYFQFDSLMTAAALMNYYTANAKIRPRYAEHLLNRWNVKIQDARLQLSEFIGANTISITSQGVVQTSAGSEGQTQQGNITGQMWGNGSGLNFNYKAMEHGIIISILLVKPANVYELGFNPLFKKRTRFEIPTPEMVNLPDTPIMRNELIPYGTASTYDGIIGYKTIYDEYRTKVNKITGRIRPSDYNGFRTYTLARKFGHNVNIAKIVKCLPDTNRIKQFTDQPDFILFAGQKTQTSIPLPYTSNVQLAL